MDIIRRLLVVVFLFVGLPYSFMLVEVVGDEMYFQSITDKAVTIDAGSIRRVGKIEPTPNVAAQPVTPQAKPSPTQPGPTPTPGK